MKRRGRPIQFEGPWADLAVACGGLNELARQIGIHSTEIWKWRKGIRQPKESSRRAIAELAQKHGVRDPFEVAERA